MCSLQVNDMQTVLGCCLIGNVAYIGLIIKTVGVCDLQLPCFIINSFIVSTARTLIVIFSIIPFYEGLVKFYTYQ